MGRCGRASIAGLRSLVTVALALALAALVAACGSGGQDKATAAKTTPATLLAQSAGSADTIKSGNIDVAATVALNGVKRLDGQPIALDVSGPFTRQSGRLAADLTVKFAAAKTNADASLDVVGGVVYVGLGGRFYELRRRAARAGSGATGTTGATGTSGIAATLRRLGLDPSDWLSSPRVAGTANVGGVTTEHLHAQIDVANVLADLAPLITRASGATGASGAAGASGASGVASPLSSDLRLIESAITSATLDVYTGVADHIVRRVALAIDFTVPPIAAGVLDGLTGGSLDFVATLTDVNQPQSITAPPNAQPASKLLNGVLALESQFGSLAPFVKQLESLAAIGSSGGMMHASHASIAAAG
jgi:hypothetical protein